MVLACTVHFVGVVFPSQEASRKIRAKHLPFLSWCVRKRGAKTIHPSNPCGCAVLPSDATHLRAGVVVDKANAVYAKGRISLSFFKGHSFGDELNPRDDLLAFLPLDHVLMLSGYQVFLLFSLPLFLLPSLSLLLCLSNVDAEDSR